jgi:hypothetical protein
MVAPQQIIKKIKVRGFYILHNKNCQFYNICQHWVEFGVLFGFECKLSVKIGKTIAKRKTCSELTIKVTIVER